MSTHENFSLILTVIRTPSSSSVQVAGLRLVAGCLDFLDGGAEGLLGGDDDGAFACSSSFCSIRLAGSPSTEEGDESIDGACFRFMDGAGLIMKEVFDPEDEWSN